MLIQNLSFQSQGIPPKTSDLDSLFTDLDPLGTGVSKPFVDKKDFFTASKKAPRLTGASDDSLNNVGLNMSDPFFVESNLGASAGVSDSAYTNSFMSSSSALSSSKLSDSFWCPASTPPPSRPGCLTRRGQSDCHDISLSDRRLTFDLQVLGSLVFYVQDREDCSGMG